MAKQILAQQEAKRAEEARIKALQDEENARIAAEEAAEEEARRLADEEKERKKKKQADKIAAQKADGTYKTKAQKEKEKKQNARLQAMRAAGIEVPDKSAIGKPKEKFSMIDEQNNNKKRQQRNNKQSPQSSKASNEESMPAPPDTNNINNDEHTPLPPPVVTSTADDSDDDWERVGDALAEELKTSIMNGDDEEDQIAVQERKEKERLRQLGIERVKRDNEKRLQEEKEAEMRAEMERKEREAAIRKDESRERRRQRDREAMEARRPDVLRSPISVIMGHVDTGKTKLLDKIRNTSVQEGEAGGITQQIGATQFPKETLMAQTNVMQKHGAFDVEIPGLLMIDTPGHESFTNLRNRGSTLCDIAILVIDLMHGLEQQTIESLNMLRQKKAPFVVALNKIDRCYGWKAENDTSIKDALERQDENTLAEFRDRSQKVILQLNELGCNAKLYWDNDSPEDTISLIPTSAITGEGIPDILYHLVTYSQNNLRDKLMYVDIVQCSVLEVKVIEGLGTTVDVVLVNGVLKEGDTIIVSTMEGPVVSQVRALLTPPPNREMRVKSEYVHHHSIQGAIGVKIVAPDIGRAVAGTSVLVLQPGDDENDVKEDVQSDLTSIMKGLATDAQGVMVHASTLGALEALLQFLREECDPPIPVGHISIGTIYKKDVMRAGLMHDKGMPEFASILAFDVNVDNSAQLMSEELNVKIFTADIIYHLFDQFSAYMGGILAERKTEAEKVAVFPTILKVLPQFIFNKKDPVVIGVEVLEGTLKIGTPLTVPATDYTFIGKVIAIENNRKDVTFAKKGTSVSVKISNESNPSQMYGRHFDDKHPIYSKISRQSINALKEFFKTDVTKEEWILLKKMKKVFDIE